MVLEAAGLANTVVKLMFRHIRWRRWGNIRDLMAIRIFPINRHCTTTGTGAFRKILFGTGHLFGRI
jgi:hypothetical protein